jgi:Cdc6-like AAA superfamily ATPase
MYSWQPALKDICDRLSKEQNNQPFLINELKTIGVKVVDDEDPKGTKIPLDVIDPFTFLSYLVAKPTQTVSLLNGLCKRWQISHVVSDASGVPTPNAQQVWLFGYKYHRQNGCIPHLWKFFQQARGNVGVTTVDFDAALKFKQVGPAVLTMGLYLTSPQKYLCVNTPLLRYLNNVHGWKTSLNPKNIITSHADYEAFCNKVLSIPSVIGTGFDDLTSRSYQHQSISRKQKTIVESDDAVVNGSPTKCPLNTILYGPPGTGKTYRTVLLAAQIVAGRIIDDKHYEEARKIFKEHLGKSIEMVTFHQSYSYEDFVQGIRPDTENETLTFAKRDGIFKIMADRARSDERASYVLIIDEINRANISRVFGELITLIETDKRTKGVHAMEVTLPSGDKFSVPSNLYIIGTMNTADKSIALLDIALRRRFDFEAMYPQYEIGNEVFNDAELLTSINQQIIKIKGHDFQIGHAYFIGSDYNRAQVMNNRVIPLLMEYFMNDTKKVREILNNAGLIVHETAWPLQVIA